MRSVLTAGGAIADIATGQLTPTHVAADAAAVYWVNQGATSNIMKKVGAAAAVEVVAATGTDKYPALTLAGTKLYYAHKNDVHQVGTDGTNDIIVATSVNYDKPAEPLISGDPMGMAVNATRVVFTTPGGRNSV